jgi:C1A family cysteine protease
MTNYIIAEEQVSGRRLGRNVNHDVRSLRYLVSSPARALQSTEHERVTPVLDQGSLGSCTGNASCGALGTKPIYDALPSGHPALDESLAVNIYSEATKIDPYDGTYPPTDTGSDGLSVAKVCTTMGFISGYLHATSLEAMQNALQDTPVIVGVNWYEGFDNPDSNGVVTVSGKVRGGHEFEVIGIDMEKSLFHAVNSWGTGWGVNGHFYFSFDSMTRLLSEDGDCTQLLPLTVPAPTPTPTPTDVTFPGADPAVDARIRTAASRGKLGLADWQNNHYKKYFKMH